MFWHPWLTISSIRTTQHSTLQTIAKNWFEPTVNCWAAIEDRDIEMSVLGPYLARSRWMSLPPLDPNPQRYHSTSITYQDLDLWGLRLPWLLIDRDSQKLLVGNFSELSDLWKALQSELCFCVQNKNVRINWLVLLCITSTPTTPLQPSSRGSKHQNDNSFKSC